MYVPLVTFVLLGLSILLLVLLVPMARPLELLSNKTVSHAPLERPANSQAYPLQMAAVQLATTVKQAPPSRHSTHALLVHTQTRQTSPELRTVSHVQPKELVHQGPVVQPGLRSAVL